MPLKHIIAHKISRSQPLEPSQLQARTDEWPMNGISEELFRELKSAAIKRSGKEYGKLQHEADHPLSAWISELIENRLGFVSFSSKIAEQLKAAMDKNEETLEGYLVVSFEEAENSEVLHIHFVQHAAGIYLDSQIDISDALILDTSGMRLAGKINISDLMGQDLNKRNNAVTLLRWRGEKDLSDAFAQMLGFSDKLDVSAETEAFLEVVDEYTKDLPEIVASGTKARVVDYCLQQDSIGKPVVYEELATELQNQPEIKSEKPYSPPPKFSQFIAEKKPEAKAELIPDKTQIRNYVRLSGRNEQLSMSFASSCLGDTVVYDPETDSLTIKNIPATLKNRLKKHFQP